MSVALVTCVSVLFITLNPSAPSALTLGTDLGSLVVLLWMGQQGPGEGTQETVMWWQGPL